MLAFSHHEFVNDHRHSDREEAYEECVGENLVFIDSGALTAVVNELVVGLRKSDDEGVEGEEDASWREEEVFVFLGVVPSVRED